MSPFASLDVVQDARCAVAELCLPTHLAMEREFCTDSCIMVSDRRGFRLCSCWCEEVDTTIATSCPRLGTLPRSWAEFELTQPSHTCVDPQHFQKYSNKLYTKQPSDEFTA